MVKPKEEKKPEFILTPERAIDVLACNIERLYPLINKGSKAPPNFESLNPYLKIIKANKIGEEDFGVHYYFNTILGRMLLQMSEEREDFKEGLTRGLAKECFNSAARYAGDLAFHGDKRFHTPEALALYRKAQICYKFSEQLNEMQKLIPSDTLNEQLIDEIANTESASSRIMAICGSQFPLGVIPLDLIPRSKKSLSGLERLMKGSKLPGITPEYLTAFFSQKY